MATHNVQSHLALLASGTEPIYAAANVGGDRYLNDDPDILCWVANSGAPQIVTIRSNQPSSFGTQPDKFYTMPTGVFLLPYLDSRRFNDLDGYVDFEFASPANIQIAVVKMGRIYKESDVRTAPV